MGIAAQIVEQYPDLTPAQVHAALTYYYDHQNAMDAALVTSYKEAEQQRHHHTQHPKLVAARGRRDNAASVHGRARQDSDLRVTTSRRPSPFKIPDAWASGGRE